MNDNLPLLSFNESLIILMQSISLYVYALFTVLSWLPCLVQDRLIANKSVPENALC